ncbi:Tetratricopeptide (TPR) repeat containing protein [Candidatus Methanophagaceae archaeon]|nr:Tetratricopeptide (TPR) repeat containing protein [Methanophagales archaeon]
MTNLDDLEDLLHRGEKGKAYELIKEDNGITAEILMNEGISFGIIGDYKLSISYFEFAVKISENNEIKAAARKNLAVAYYNRGIAYNTLKQHEKAIEDFNKALELNLKYAEAYNNRGNAYAKLKQHETAIEDYNKALELNLNDATAYCNRGTTYGELKQHEKAIEDYSKAIELNLKYTTAYNNRGNAYGKLKLYKSAIEDYSKAIELDPKYAEAYNNRGTAYDELKEHEKAIEDYNKAIELNPKYAMAYYNRGNTYGKLKQHEKAIEDYSKAIELDLKYAEAYNNRGTAYDELQQYEGAIEDYNKAIELNQNDAEAYNNRGASYYKLNKLEGAIVDYNKAIELNPKYAMAYANRGITQLQTNEDLDKAIEDFKQARSFFEGKEKERMLGFIEWAKARKELIMKNWDDFREHMKEARGIFDRINDPLAPSLDAFINFSFLDEELDNALSIPDPIEALKEIEKALKNVPVIEGLIEPEKTIFGARISSFAILSEFIRSMRGIDENTDLGVVKAELTKLLGDSKEVEDAFESVKFAKGKTTIVDMQDIISATKEEIGKIEYAPNKKQKALEILKKYWSRLGPAIRIMNGTSTRAIEDIALMREIREMRSESRVGFAEIRGGLSETREIISKGFEKSSEEHKEILEIIYETKNIFLQKDVVNARYRIEFQAPLISSLSPISPKIIVDIPMGNLTEEQIAEKADEIAAKLKDLSGKVKSEFFEAIKRVPETGEKLLKRLKKTKG